MVAHINTVAFQGIEVLGVNVQVQTASGLPAFTIVGLPDKAVGESRERRWWRSAWRCRPSGSR